MYPESYPRNQWYVAAHSDEVGRTLLDRWLLDEPVVLYRKLDGTPVALVNRCIHRQMPLSLGRLKDDRIECGYHGILYNAEGRAERIPSQPHVPPACRVTRFLLFERWGLVWIWMGDPDKADEGLVPDHHWITDPEWGTVRGSFLMKARAQLLNENLLDLSHLEFLHAGSIGTDKIAETPVTTEFDGRVVRVSRPMYDIDCPPFFTKVMGITGRIDRGQVAEYFAPGFHITHVSAKPTGDPDDSRKCSQKAIHCVTPARRNTAHYFWCHARDYKIDDLKVAQLMRQGMQTVFQQDVDASEAIEEIISSYEPAYPIELNLKVDAGPLQARRLIQQMLAAEKAG
ncbi:aromatic ring-hydroxylating dioxygenase subunit alpha [Streptomyces justiciae]|uniref:aromatic ring-hydroxylating dioxygenase subunit alpha n=1 Tax=Streptomyces justiciae TaxID=2780140 RepID=UPI002118BC83|nr:aromatic ring-hydroxylating dioxygenase subunit alpha [Streptomyces justiciae]MCW8379716.1 aromatic ring-hydroxylating dioxygenase subunit alpha [Streptomyces justiciae]